MLLYLLEPGSNIIVKIYLHIGYMVLPGTIHTIQIALQGYYLIPQLRIRNSLRIKGPGIAVKILTLF